MSIWVDMISISKVETKMKEQMNKDEDRKLKLTVTAPNLNPNHLHPPGHQQQQQHHSTRPHSPPLQNPLHFSIIMCFHIELIAIGTLLWSDSTDSTCTPLPSTEHQRAVSRVWV